MKKFLLTLFATCVISNPALSLDDKDMEVYKVIYENIQNKQINPVNAVEMSSLTLKSLSKIDKKTSLANDDTRISIYYNGRIYKSYLKPKDESDVAAATSVLVAAHLVQV